MGENRDLEKRNLKNSRHTDKFTLEKYAFFFLLLFITDIPVEF